MGSSLRLPIEEEIPVTPIGVPVPAEPTAPEVAAPAGSPPVTGEVGGVATGDDEMDDDGDVAEETDDQTVVLKPIALPSTGAAGAVLAGRLLSLEHFGAFRSRPE